MPNSTASVETPRASRFRARASDSVSLRALVQWQLRRQTSRTATRTRTSPRSRTRTTVGPPSGRVAAAIFQSPMRLFRGGAGATRTGRTSRPQVRNNRYGAHRCTDFGAICIIPNAGLLLFVLIVASGDADAVTKKERPNQNSNRGGRRGGAGFSEGGFDRSDLSNW
jgi:hypothetical protein